MARPSTHRLALVAALVAVFASIGGRMLVAEGTATASLSGAPVSAAPGPDAGAMPAGLVPAAAPNGEPASDASTVLAPAAASEPEAAASAPLVRGPRALYDVAYDSASPAQRLDLRVPGGTAPAPLVVYVHGGGWITGDKAGPDDLGVVDPLVARGFAVASINYRLAPEVVYPSPVDDVRTALGWLRTNGAALGVDPTRVALFGVSAGAQLATLAGLLEGGDVVRAVVDWQGPVDLGSIRAQLRADRGCGGLFDDPDDPASFWAAYVGGPVNQEADVVAAADPRGHLADNAHRPRFLVAHGDHDCVVPVAQSRLLADALQAAGDVVELRVVPGAGHARQFPAMAELPIAADFLVEALGA